MNIFSKILGLILGTNPPTPPANRRLLFAKADGWYEKDAAGVTTKLATVDDASPSYLVYTALLTQTGTDAPVATVLENTLGGTVVWGYLGVGNYTATLSGAFPSEYTVIPQSGAYQISSGDLHYFINATRESDNVISIATIDAVDGMANNSVNEALYNKFFEIRVYP